MAKKHKIEHGERAAAAATSLVELTPFFKAFCNTTRASIIDLLLDGERCVCEITPAIEASQPLVSHHLAILREAGFVRMREQGSRTYYAIDWDAFDGRVGEFLALAERGRAAATVQSEAC